MSRGTKGGEQNMGGRGARARSTAELTRLTPAVRQRISQAAGRSFLRQREEELNRRARELQKMRERAGMT